MLDLINFLKQVMLYSNSVRHIMCQLLDVILETQSCIAAMCLHVHL